MMQEGINPYAVGLGPMLAQAEICLKVRLGSIPYDRTLGSTLYTLRNTPTVQNEALRAAQKALRRLHTVQVQQVRATFTEDTATYAVQVETPCGAGTVTVRCPITDGE